MIEFSFVNYLMKHTSKNISMTRFLVIILFGCTLLTDKDVFLITYS